MNHTGTLSHCIFLLLVLCTSQACDDHSITQDHESYFPLDDGSTWHYQRWIANAGDSAVFDTLKVHIHGEVTVEGHVYKEVMDSEGMIRIVRTEGSRYYGRNHELYSNDAFSHEYMFLDTDKPVGESWSYLKDSGQTKTEYVVIAKNSSRNILQKRYTDVIELQVNYYNRMQTGHYELWLSAIHYYAKGVGEIFHYYPYPVSGRYGNVSSFMLSVENK